MAAMAATTDPQTAPPSPNPNPKPDLAEDTDAALVEDDLLVEEISIDGMCGVY
jgi:mycofactocin precursor